LLLGPKENAADGGSSCFMKMTFDNKYRALIAYGSGIRRLLYNDAARQTGCGQFCDQFSNAGISCITWHRISFTPELLA
jgi:hypothetical protein